MIREPKWTRRQLAELKRLFETGVPYIEIVEALGRSASAIKTRAQLCGFRRPRRLGRKESDALQAYALNLGLDEAIRPTNPTALRVLICLAQTDISTKLGLDKACLASESGRNKAVQSLRSSGLVYVDDFCSPVELVLTRKAYCSRPEPMLADDDQIRAGTLPSMTALCSELDAWLPVICRSKTSSDKYRAFIIRQLENAQSGDIATADFYSIFYNPKRR